MSKSIGKYLDELLDGTASKQETVTALQRQRSKEIQKARVELEKKLDKVYTDFENNTPPTTSNKSELTWNDGFYQGELKALETVSKEVFNKSGEQLEKGGKK